MWIADWMCALHQPVSRSPVHLTIFANAASPHQPIRDPQSAIRNPKLKYATFSKERTIYRFECFANSAANCSGREKAACDQDMVAAFDDLAGYGRPDIRRTQRQTPHTRFYYREYGRAQAWGILTDADVQRTSGNKSGEDGEEEIVDSGRWSVVRKNSETEH